MGNQHVRAGEKGKGDKYFPERRGKGARTYREAAHGRTSRETNAKFRREVRDEYLKGMHRGGAEGQKRIGKF